MKIVLGQRYRFKTKLSADSLNTHITIHDGDIVTVVRPLRDGGDIYITRTSDGRWLSAFADELKTP